MEETKMIEIELTIEIKNSKNSLNGGNIALKKYYFWQPEAMKLDKFDFMEDFSSSVKSFISHKNTAKGVINGI